MATLHMRIDLPNTATIAHSVAVDDVTLLGDQDEARRAIADMAFALRGHALACIAAAEATLLAMLAPTDDEAPVEAPTDDRVPSDDGMPEL